MAANDGQRFEDQSWETQESFRAVYGSGAAAAWEREHNASIGNRRSSSSSSDDDDDDGRDAFRESAGNQRQVHEDNLGLSKDRLGLDRDRLEQEDDQFDATLKYKLKQLKLERDRIAIARGEAAADLWYKQQQVRLADQTHGLAMGTLGLDYLKTRVEYMSSPDNYFKLADFDAGANARQDVPLFLQNLQAGVQGRPYGAPGGMPTPQSIEGGIQALGGSLAPAVGAVGGFNGGTGGGLAATGQPSGTAGWSAQDVAALNSIGQIYQQGAHKLAPGSLEGMSSDNRALLGAGIARLGGSTRAFTENYLRSRPGQGDTRAA